MILCGEEKSVENLEVSAVELVGGFHLSLRLLDPG
jgi:hypothetical protein